jgi:inner membrane protein involved in colicin E2 resistance
VEGKRLVRIISAVHEATIVNTGRKDRKTSVEIKKPYAFVLTFVPCIFYSMWNEQTNAHLIGSFIKLFIIYCSYMFQRRRIIFRELSLGTCELT